VDLREVHGAVIGPFETYKAVAAIGVLCDRRTPAVTTAVVSVIAD
jgi:hypothetical protein